IRRIRSSCVAAPRRESAAGTPRTGEPRRSRYLGQRPRQGNAARRKGYFRAGRGLRPAEGSRGKHANLGRYGPQAGCSWGRAGGYNPRAMNRAQAYIFRQVGVSTVFIVVTLTAVIWLTQA